jgi:ribonuclease T2
MIAANPGLRPDMMAISCGGAGNRLKEVRICFTKSGQLRPCGRNENQQRMCSARQMYVPPVRSTWKDPRAKDRNDRSTGDRSGQRTDERAPAGQHKSDYLPGPRI